MITIFFSKRGKMILLITYLFSFYHLFEYNFYHKEKSNQTKTFKIDKLEYLRKIFHFKNLNVGIIYVQLKWYFSLAYKRFSRELTFQFMNSLLEVFLINF